MSKIARIQDSNCGSIRCLKAILDQWIECVTEAAEEWILEWWPWAYNERASLSLFAGAIWRADGSCFGEYSNVKRPNNRRSRRAGTTYPGRVDLRFSWHGTEFVAEAKQTWSGFEQQRESAHVRIAECLDEAREDIGQVPPGGPRRLAIVFARPYFNSCGDLDVKLERWVEMLEKLETSAYTYVFPRCARNRKAP